MTTLPRTSPPAADLGVDRSRRVAVIGGGASGTLTALNVLRAAPGHVGVTVFEASGRIGYGVAYATTDRRHLLNVPARNMSAFPDAPADLVEWARASGRDVDPADFLPRADYAVYLRDRLRAISRRHPGRLATVGEQVVDLEPLDGAFVVRTARGTQEAYDAVVLAYGNAAPSWLSVGGEPLPQAPWHVANPWDLSWITALPPDATVVIVGTGLTAVDTAISVLEDAPGRRAVMVSRHGLVPEAHAAPCSPAMSTGWVTPVPPGPLTADGIAALVAEQLRAAAARDVDWRVVVDGLRGPTQSIWGRLDLAERRRFLARYARRWEVRRHRMAPGVAALLDGYRAAGRLEILAGGLSAVACGGAAGVDGADGAAVQVEVGGRVVGADAVVNCTGPLIDVERADNPLLAALLRRGLVAPDPLRLGLSCTPAGEVLGRDGRVPGLFTVGPPRKGVLFETTAIPEIRVQAAEVAGLVGAPHS
ncbi:FAD/NAD(P)-binding protein [Nocardioides sp. DS6]|uniref:FAD/NAD(P)-binding protein n=1 Tax=Nocardioides eburneus TaxID=3231482 RepID=A0ABV3SVC4_9ACTN